MRCHTSLSCRRLAFVAHFLDELKYKKICYFTNWAQYRLGPARFEPESIDPFLCTHIIYAFAYLDNQTLTISKLEDNDEGLSTLTLASRLTYPPSLTIRSLPTCQSFEDAQSKTEDTHRCRRMEHEIVRFFGHGAQS